MTATLSQSIALIGPMGAGKSFIGEQLAQHLDVAFIDIDREIEQAAGMTIPDIFAHQGEAAFRLLEEQALAELLQRQEPAVIATGGGCVLAKANRQQLKDHCWVVYLQVSGPVAIARCAERPQLRPLLQDKDPLSRWEAITHEREVHYDSLANSMFETDGVPAQALLEQIMTAREQQHG
jgi:shikimate kinase